MCVVITNRANADSENRNATDVVLYYCVACIN
jgi:hypothetical protein